MMVEFDRRLLAQALTNILKNADVKASTRWSRRTDKGRIQRVAQGRPTRATPDIAVRDNGKGFSGPGPPASLTRALHVTTRAEGTGLGLPIVAEDISKTTSGGLELLDGTREGRVPGRAARLPQS